MRGLLLLVLAALVLAIAGWVWWHHRPLPAGLTDSAAKYDVEILRDEWGVPHIFGTTDADVAYGLAFAHAEDDFRTIQGALLASRGRLASVFGQDAAPNDFMVGLLRVQETVRQNYGSLGAATRLLCDAYADGLNHYAALHPDAAMHDLYPVRGEDIVAGFVHKTPLFFDVDVVLTDLFADNRMHPVSERATAPQHPVEGAATPLGSNGFAIGPSRTADGGTFLAVNSHQPWEGAVAWYEAHLHSEEGLDIVGGTFPGAPVILHGHNRKLGWALTVNHADLTDVFVLEMNPDNPDQYRFDGQWLDLEKGVVEIEVKLLGPLHWTVEREVLWTVYGPAVRRPHGVYAIRYAGLGEIGLVEQWYRMNRADSFARWRAAMRMQAIPTFNAVYADAEGTVYYLYNARLPLRDPAYDWQTYLPGDTSATLWSDYVPFDSLPQVLNPPSGFVQNANSTPFRTTVGPGNPDPAAFSPTDGIETEMTNRAYRALHLFGADASITWQEFVAYKFDRTYAPESKMAARIKQVLAAPAPADTLTRTALAHLRAWNLRTDADNPHAALAVLAFQPFIDRTDGQVATDTLLYHLTAAAQTLHRTFGRLNVPWQTVHRIRRGKTDLGLAGGPDVLHAIHSRQADDGRLVGYAGDSYVLLARWDSSGTVHSESIHQFGSNTLDTTSAHYADQALLFSQRLLKPVWMNETEIRAHLERAYRPGE